MSAPEGKTDVPREPGHFRFWRANLVWQLRLPSAAHSPRMAFSCRDIRLVRRRARGRRAH